MTVGTILSHGEQESLRQIAALMIPRSEHYQVPGADDDTIFSDILAVAQTESESVLAALKVIDGLCLAQCSKVLGELDDEEQATMLPEFSESRDPDMCLLVRLVVQCYYRDARVLHALRLPVRARYPEGFVVEQGDWSLLDPVKQRPKFYREV